MEILWTAVGISVIVGFVLYVWAGHLGGVLRKQSLALRHLSDRLHLLEEAENPQFRQRLSEFVPPPLEQVFTFSFRFDERFWRETLGLSEGDWTFVRTYGSFVASVKLERWRSHTVATITEVLPNRQTAAWKTRSIEFYPNGTGRDDALTLWELPLSRPHANRRPPALSLSLGGDALDLHIAGNGANSPGPADNTLFRAPLDLAALSRFRTENPAAAVGNGSGHLQAENAVPWQTFHAWEDESRGVAWHLHVRDLTRKAEWERWKILESPTPPLVRTAAQR